METGNWKQTIRFQSKDIRMPSSEHTFEGNETETGKSVLEYDIYGSLQKKMVLDFKLKDDSIHFIRHEKFDKQVFPWYPEGLSSNNDSLVVTKNPDS